MRQFLDEQNRTWGIRVDVTTLRKVRERVGIDLTKVFSSRESLEGLVCDVITLVDVLHALCLEQCESRKVDAEGFATALYGDSIDRATSALMESIIDFFPQGRGKILRQLWDKSKQIAEIEQQRLTEAVQVLTSENLSQRTQATPE